MKHEQTNIFHKKAPEHVENAQKSTNMCKMNTRNPPNVRKKYKKPQTCAICLQESLQTCGTCKKHKFVKLVQGKSQTCGM